MRSGLRELMRFAESKDYRPAGSNPVDSLKTMNVKARKKYITDSELRRIKVAAMYGDDGKRTRSGPMLCALIDLAYLTGQRIGDLLDLRWANVKQDGIYFKPGKTEGSTGASVLIGWTPKLSAVIGRIKALKRRSLTHVIFMQEGQPYTYYGASSAWMRAVKRSGMENCHFHDLRAKAITDKEGAEGMQQARRMGAHSTEGQTADYVRHRKAQRTGATK
jgi:integrase